MAERVECVVIGAGVIGLAVARRLAQGGREVVIVEAGDSFGSEISSRNSEVIHAGIYYPPGSLKARLCREGRDRLYAYLTGHGIAYERCGKLIVATADPELPALRALEHRARRNGVEDIRHLDGAAARAMEPALRCVAALHSPSTGIFDSHAFMLSLLGEAEQAGTTLALATPLVGGAIGEDGIRLATGGAQPTEVLASLVVNAAGLGAQAVAGSIRGFPGDRIPLLHYAKGNYFALSQRSPFAALVYPVPDEAGLGVHYTRDLAGAGRFGPDVEWVDRPNYAVDPVRGEGFYRAIRRYWPELRDGALSPDYAGIRPKIAAPGAPAADFLIQGPEAHGVPGLVNLFGIESPGLTAALAIADEVAARLGLRRRRPAPDP